MLGHNIKQGVFYPLPEKTNTDLEYVQGQFILTIGDYLK